MRRLKGFRTPVATGVFFILLSAIAFTLMSVFVRNAGDLPAAQKALFRNLISFTFAAFLLFGQKRETKKVADFALKTARNPLILRATFGTLGVLLHFYAIDHLPLADANSLNKLSPFFAVLASLFLLKEKVKRYQWGSLIFAFSGALFILRPGADLLRLKPAHFLAVLGALSAGLAYTYVRKLGLLKVDGAFIVFFFSAFSLVLFLPLTLVQYQPMTKEQVIFLLLAGLAASFGQIGITLAYRYAPARSLSVYNYVQIPLAAILGYFLYRERPDLLSFVGYAMIIGAALYIYVKEQKQ